MPSPFRPATELMVQYAAYHRDRRNIATHFVGIPLIVFAIGIFTARAQFDVAQVHATAAWVLWGLTAAWYLTRGNLVLGLATSIVNGLLIWAAHPFAISGVGAWLACGLTTFITGWVLFARKTGIVDSYSTNGRPIRPDNLGIFSKPLPHARTEPDDAIHAIGRKK